MVRYTAEQKAQALESIKSIGVPKTFEELNISKQTLYKWSAEEKDNQHPAVTKTRKQRKPSATNTEASKIAEMEKPVNHSAAPTSVGTYNTDVEEMQTLLSNDDLLEKINRLEDENRVLRETNVKLKKIIANFIA